MLAEIKGFLFVKFFHFLPRMLQDPITRTMTLVPKKELDEKFSDAVVRLKRNGNIGDYLEFGVFRGTSLLCMYRALENNGIKNVRLFGFDSFEGMPNSTDAHDKKLPWRPGWFRSSYEETTEVLDKAGVNWKKVFLIKGWYSNTLNKELVEKHKINNVSLIMIDCDIYSSSKQALNFCAPLINKEAIIFFDDWDASENLAERNLGEKQAFDEFLKENSQFKAKEIGFYHHSEMKSRPIAKIFLVSKKTIK